MSKKKLTREYRTFVKLEHWKPTTKVIAAENLLSKDNKLYFLFLYLYKKTKQAYKKFPLRKDGNDPFLHPLNIVYYLKKAKVEDGITFCAALIHDLIEESVDIYQMKKAVKLDKMGIEILDDYEQKLFMDLEIELKQFCERNKIDLVNVKKLLAVVKLLTRHKRHLYYRSISAIFTCNSQKTKERAIQVKLADRMHNIQSLEGFSDQKKIYQSFKNLFILNNTKRYLLKKYGDKERKKISSTERIFKKCCKATYDAFLQVLYTLGTELIEVRSTIQLSLKKFIWENGGLWAVTQINPREVHPIRLFQGIIRKYDARLHQEPNKYRYFASKEIDYCRKFFANFNFSESELQTLVNYKDALAMKEVIARLLYKRKYVIFRFGCTELCSRGRICMGC